MEPENLHKQETAVPLKEYLRVETTSYGVILKRIEGGVMLPPGMFEQMVTKLESLQKGMITAVCNTKKLYELSD